MLPDSSMASGYFRDGVLVADRSGRPVVAIQDPEDQSVIYVTETGRIVAKDRSSRQDSRHWLVIGMERFLILSGMGFWLLVLLIVVGGKANSEEVPAWVLRGIAAVETGTTWRDIGDLHYADKRVGADGEVGPWQLAPSVLKDMGVLHLMSRIHRDPVLAESMTRAWLLRCYLRTGDWFQAVCIYHTGPHGDQRRGQNYAARVRAAGITN